ncbi:MAG TPA: hypothetical protein VF782_00285 [Allosphingosinicella sp.]|jgi:hypothetical protein
MSRQRLLHDIIPRDRLSVSLISGVLTSHPQLGRWSREEAGAIRPRRLALVVRTNMWLALNRPVSEMKSGLHEASTGAVDYSYPVTVKHDHDSPPVALAARARFTRRWSGRIVVEIYLESRPVMRCPFLLPLSW